MCRNGATEERNNMNDTTSSKTRARRFSMDAIVPGAAAEAYRTLTNGADFDAVSAEINAGGAVYDIAPKDVAVILYHADAVLGFLNDYGCGVLDDLVAGIKADCSGNDSFNAAAHICGTYGIPDGAAWMIASYAFELAYGPSNFYAERDIVVKRFHAGDYVGALQYTLGVCKFSNRVRRCLNLIRLGTPASILAVELKNLTEAAIMALHCDRLVRPLPCFEELYGVKPDGSRGTVPCRYGDAELCPDDEDDEEDGCAGENDGHEEDAGSGDRFEPVYVPNFLMFDGRDTAIWDNLKDGYVRCPDGTVELHNGEPAGRLKDLNSGAAGTDT